MTPEERFERIETALYGLIEAQRLNSEGLKGLTESVDRYIAATTSYVDAANARMAHMEENLDALIRIITAEHNNGKGLH